MALVPLTSVDELERRLGKTIPDGAERDRADALLSDASTLVRHAAGATWVDAEGDLTDVPDLAVTITIAAAIRAWFNPAGVTAQQLGAVSVRYADVWLTGKETDQLAQMTRQSVQSIELEHGFGFKGDTNAGWVPYDHTGLGPAPGDYAPIGY